MAQFGLYFFIPLFLAKYPAHMDSSHTERRGSSRIPGNLLLLQVFVPRLSAIHATAFVFIALELAIDIFLNHHLQ